MGSTLRKVILPSIVLVLADGFWISPDFKEISAGVAIFLFGMLALEERFRAFTGGALEKILKKSTNRMWKSLTFGFTAATVMQSGPLVSVITISFLSVGLISLVEGLEAFQNSLDLTAYAMEGMEGILVFTLIGIIATIIMQSSHATLVLIITALSVQQISYDNALAIGANVGTTITAVFGALSSNVEGERLALADVLFKVCAGIMFIIFMQSIMNREDVMSSGIGLVDDDYSMGLVVFHTVFNVAGVIIMLPLINPLIALVTDLFKSEPDIHAGQKYLNEASLEFGDTALEAQRKESARIYAKASMLLPRDSLWIKRIFSLKPPAV